MDQKRLEKLRGELIRRRRSPQKASDLIPLAESLGRKRVKRGKEPTWESQELDVPPLSIPVHKGRDLSPRVRNIVLDVLEGDLLEWEERLRGSGQLNEEDDDKGS
jgi:hypothetical protein